MGNGYAMCQHRRKTGIIFSFAEKQLSTSHNLPCF